MMGLTYNWTAMNNLVNSMQPNGGTNQPIGLVWGWHSLVGGGPLTAPAKDSNYTYQDVIVLMSDGLNTQDRWYGNGQRPTPVDKRMYDHRQRLGHLRQRQKLGRHDLHHSGQYRRRSDLDAVAELRRQQRQNGRSDQILHGDTSSGLGTVFSAIGTSLTQLRVAK